MCPSDVQAEAWAELANAYRVNDDLAEAEEAFGRARTLLRRGSGDLRILARLAAFEASLRGAQRRFFEARELLDRVYRLNLRRGDRHLAGEALFVQGMSVQYGGDSLAAVRLLRKAVVLLDPDRDPQVVSVGQQGLIHALVDCGEYRKAGELLLKSDLRQSFTNEPLKLLKLRWLETKFMLSRGRHADAERALSHVQREFQERGKEYDAALVGLDLLPVRLRQGHAREARETAKNILVTFEALGIHREAARTRRYLQ
jgi:tetratricopeptide (TPR) repeat protein